MKQVVRLKSRKWRCYCSYNYNLNHSEGSLSLSGSNLFTMRPLKTERCTTYIHLVPLAGFLFYGVLWVVSRVVKRWTGQWLSRKVWNNIWSPLQMVWFLFPVCDPLLRVVLVVTEDVLKVCKVVPGIRGPLGGSGVCWLFYRPLGGF